MIVLVTGATAGFGECIIRRFIQQGIKRRHWPSLWNGRRAKDELGDNLYIAQLTFATAPLLKRCWHRFLPRVQY